MLARCAGIDLSLTLYDFIGLILLGCGHCQDLHTPSPSDAPELTMIRNQFRFFLKQWLAAAQ